MDRCETCKNRIPSKTHLNGGYCEKIVTLGSVQQYRNGQLVLSKDQEVGIASSDPSSMIIISLDFGCILHEDIITKEVVNENANISDKSEEVPTKVSIQPKHTKSTKDNS